MREKNIALLRKTMEFMKANPEKHQQSGWITFDDDTYFNRNETACHTAMCTAGHAAAIAGADIPTFGQSYYDGWYLNSEGKLSEYGTHVSDWVAEKLGLNMDEYNYIFLCLENDKVFERIEEVLQLWDNGEELDLAGRDF